MTSLLIRDMTEEGERYVGMCTNVCLHKETKNACVASPTVER